MKVKLSFILWASMTMITLVTSRPACRAIVTDKMTQEDRCWGECKVNPTESCPTGLVSVRETAPQPTVTLDGRGRVTCTQSTVTKKSRRRAFCERKAWPECGRRVEGDPRPCWGECKVVKRLSSCTSPRVAKAYNGEEEQKCGGTMSSAAGTRKRKLCIDDSWMQHFSTCHGGAYYCKDHGSPISVGSKCWAVVGGQCPKSVTKTVAENVYCMSKERAADATTQYTIQNLCEVTTSFKFTSGKLQVMAAQVGNYDDEYFMDDFEGFNDGTKHKLEKEIKIDKLKLRLDEARLARIRGN